MTEKKLVFENKQGVEYERSNALQVEENLNKALDLFHSMQGFAKIENEKQAFAFAENPKDYFDKCLVKAASVKPIGDSPLNPESIATMFGVNRQGFFDACQAKQPGGRTYLPISLASGNKELVRFIDGKFRLNEAVLENRLEQHRVYAVTPEQLELVEYWENLAKMLNVHVSKGYVTKFEVYQTAHNLGLKSQGDTFTVNYSELASKIKKAG